MFEFHPGISVGKRLQSDKNEANEIERHRRNCWEASIRGVAPMPGVALFWNDRRLYFNEPFRNFFEAQMKLNEHDPSLGTLTIAPGDTQ